MYKIGELSKITNIPIRTLRFYEEVGLLLPADVDKFTGYRYYNNKSILDCKIIKYLKLLGFSLKEILEYKNSFSKNIIEKKYIETDKQIKLLKKRKEALSFLFQQEDPVQTVIECKKLMKISKI